MSVYRAAGVVDVYRYLSARFHLCLSDVLGRWSMWPRWRVLHPVSQEGRKRPALPINLSVDLCPAC